MSCIMCLRHPCVSSVYVIQCVIRRCNVMHHACMPSICVIRICHTVYHSDVFFICLPWGVDWSFSKSFSCGMNPMQTHCSQPE